MLGILALGSLMFWGVFALPFFFLCYLVENEKPWGAGIVTFLTLLAAFLLLDRATVHGLIDNLPQLIGEYVGIGIAWGFGKWFFYLWRYIDGYNRVYDEFLNSQKLTSITTAEERAAFDKYLSTAPFSVFGDRVTLADVRPRVSANKDRIIFWMAYWPASAFWTILNDPLSRLFRFVFNRFASVFEGMSKAMFRRFARGYVE